MANKVWQGKAVNIKQIGTIVVANTWTAADTATLTIDGLDFVITIGSLITTAQVATTIKQAINGETFTDSTASCTISIADGGAQTIPQFSEIVATVSSSTVTLTARTADKPFTISGTESTASTGTITVTSAATAATGRRHASNADNYVANAIPADNDALVFDSGNIDCRYGLDLACQPATITKYKAYTGNVGLPQTDIDNAAKPYREYRTPTYLTTDDNTVNMVVDLEVGPGQGSGRFKLNAGAGQVTMNIHGRGQRAETGVPCILFKGTHASNEVNNIGGDLGLGFYVGDSTTVPTLRTGGSASSPAETICTSDCTLTTVTTMNNGKTWTDSAITTAHILGKGTHYHRSGTVTTVNALDGTFYPMEDATLTTVNIGPNGILDCRQGTDAFAVTNTIQMHAGAKLYDPAGRISSLVVKLNQCGPDDVTLVLPPNKTYTLS